MNKTYIIAFQVLPGPVDSRKLAVAGILKRNIVSLVVFLISESSGILYFLCVATTIVALKCFSDISDSKEI